MKQRVENDRSADQDSRVLARCTRPSIGARWMQLLVTVLCVGVWAVLSVGAAHAQEDSETPPSPRSMTSLLPINSTDVGVIPGPGGCPRGYDSLFIKMDDEDDDNKNSMSGWHGAIDQDRNTTWIFCRVDGNLFKHWLVEDDYAPPGAYAYAVLQLGESCPEGSRAFGRYFDNEDKNNKNFSNGDIPAAPNRWVQNTELRFCLFEGLQFGERPEMSQFPLLPFEYGVFAHPEFLGGLEGGTVHTDDEDNDNRNRHIYPRNPWQSEIDAFHHIVSGSDNTDIRLVKVQNEPSRANPDLCNGDDYCVSNPRVIDVEISLYRAFSATTNISYTTAISYFADAIYEMSNGVHTIGNVYVYPSGAHANQADIRWQTGTGASAKTSGYYNSGQVSMTDGGPMMTDANFRSRGYTLGHEWGHYFYGLKDEYQETRSDKTWKNEYRDQPHTDDDPVEPSVMNCQHIAAGSSCAGANMAGTVRLDWLNFSIAANDTRKTAQYRVYEASGWGTLIRLPTDDPRDPNPEYGEHCKGPVIGGVCFGGKDINRIETIPRQFRVYYPELDQVKPTGSQWPTHEITPTTNITNARLNLNVIWRNETAPGLEPVPIQNNTPTAPGQVQFFVDDGFSAIEVIVQHEGPDGHEVYVSVAGPNNNGGGDTDCSNGGKQTLCALLIDNPAPGIWTLTISADDTPNLTYQIIGYRQSTQPGFVSSVSAVGSNTIRYPEPAVIIAQVRKQLPVTNVGMDAYVIWPDSNRVPLTLKDDGISPDATASDGLYTGYLPYNQDGDYTVHVQFDNDDSTAEFTDIGMAGGEGTTPVTEDFQRAATTIVTVLDYRPDDHGNLPVEATALNADNTDLPGRIEYGADVDMFKVSVDTAQTLAVRVFGLAAGMQPQVRILAADGTTLLKQFEYDPNASGYPFATVQAQAGDSFYIAVAHLNSSADVGSYFISAGAPLDSSGERATSTLTLSSSTLNFSAIVGAGNPDAQFVRVGSSGDPLAWAASESLDWLTVEPISGTTPTTLTVSVDTTSLSAGSYSGALVVEAGAISETVTISLTMKDAAAPTPLVLTVDGGSTNMELSWTVTNDVNVTHYRVLRAPGSGQSFQSIAETVTDTVYYDGDAGLTVGNEYCYRVEALRQDNSLSATSNDDCGRFGQLELWVPDRVGAPGEQVIVPINVRNADGLRIAASDVWMDFDPRVIESVSISRTSLTEAYAWAHSVQVIDSDTHRVRIAYIHSNLNELPPEIHGDGSLFWLTFQVKGQPGDTSPLDLNEFIQGVGGSSIQQEDLEDVALVLDDGIFTVKDADNASYILGDVDADTVVRALDAALALRMANGERVPTALELLAGDINGNGSIDQADASMILYYAGNAQWPPVGGTGRSLEAATARTAGVRVDDVSGAPDATVQTTLRANDLYRMAGGSFVLLYDADVVQRVVDVQATGLAAGFAQVHFQDQGNGLLSISLADDAEINGSGVLLTISLQIAPDAAPGASTLRLAQAKLNDLNGRNFVTGYADHTLTRQDATITVTQDDVTQNLYLPAVQR